MNKRVTLVPRTKVANELLEFNRLRMEKAYAFPSTLQQAEIHQIANRYGYNSLFDADGAPASICPCCKLPINTQELPLHENTTPDIDKEKLEIEEFKLSSGISMFFSFIKMAIFYLLLRFILTDAFNIISSLAAGTECRDQQCNITTTGSISSYNKISQQGLVYVLDILNLVTIVISIGFFNFYRKIQYRIETLINGSQHTQDDYSLFLNGIPILLIDENVDPNNITFDYGEKLKKYFEGKLQEWFAKINDTSIDKLQQIEKELLKVTSSKKMKLSDLKRVTSVTMCFDLAQMEVLRQMRKRLMEKYVDTVAEREKQSANSTALIEEQRQSNIYENILPQIHLINQEELLLNQKFAEDSSMAFNLTHFVGRAFISFEYQHFRDYFLRETFRDKNFLRIRPDFPIEAEQASTPLDILWFNMSVQQSTRRKFIFVSYVALVMVLAFAFGGTLLMSHLKYKVNQESSQQDEKLTTFLTLLMTVCTLIINYILGVIVKYLTEYERHQTKSNFIFSHVVKVVASQFLNTTIIYYISSTITHLPYLSKEGLVVQASSLFITSAVIQVVINAINPSALMVTVFKWLKYRNKSQIKLFQRDLNQEVELAEFDIVDRYSYYILQIFACSFYAYLVPIATPCLIVAFTLQYWIDKHNLFKRSSCKHEMDFFLSRTMLKIFQASILIAAFGNYVFSIVLHNNYVNGVNVAALIIAGVYNLFSMFAPRHLQKRIFSSYEQIETKAYSDCMKEKLFKDQYWTSNPATKFVRQVDLNTKMEISLMPARARFAGANDLKQAKEQMDQLLKKEQEPKLDLNDSLRSGKPSERVNRSTIRENDI